MTLDSHPQPIPQLHQESRLQPTKVRLCANVIPGLDRGDLTIRGQDGGEIQQAVQHGRWSFLEGQGQPAFKRNGLMGRLIRERGARRRDGKDLSGRGQRVAGGLVGFGRVAVEVRETWSLET